MSLIGVEAGGDGILPGRHAARFAGGAEGVLHGTRTCLLQDADGNIAPTHSVSAGLDYAAVGPEHAWLHATGRAEYTWADDRAALAAFHQLARSRASCRRSNRRTPSPIWPARPALGPGGDHRRQPLGPRRQGRPHRRATLRETRMSLLDKTFAGLRAARRTGLVAYVTAGDPDLERSAAVIRRWIAAAPM